MYETQKKRRIRRPAAWLLAVLLTGALCCQTVWADQRTLIPVGKAVGIKLFADGVLVVSTSSDGPCPARDCGIQEGDLTGNGSVPAVLGDQYYRFIRVYLKDGYEGYKFDKNCVSLCPPTQ